MQQGKRGYIANFDINNQLFFFSLGRYASALRQSKYISLPKHAYITSEVERPDFL